jgi:hypothetical protein
MGSPRFRTTLAAQSPHEYCTGLSKLNVASWEVCAVGAVYVFDMLEAVGECVVCARESVPVWKFVCRCLMSWCRVSSTSRMASRFFEGRKRESGSRAVWDLIGKEDMTIGARLATTGKRLAFSVVGSVSDKHSFKGSTFVFCK